MISSPKGLSKQEVERMQACETSLREVLKEHKCFLSFNNGLVIPVPEGANEFLAWQWFYADMNKLRAKIRPFPMGRSKG